LQALGKSGKGGPKAVKEILAQFGAADVSSINPARWHEVHAAAQAKMAG
jgi:hypothetical protein